MPPRHHRTVDRIVGVLEYVARRPDGASLAEVAEYLDAAKSSVQELTNGLLATGYLTEQRGRLYIGDAPFALTSSVPEIPLRRLRRSELVKVHEAIGHVVLVGVRMGFNHIFIDHAGDDVELDYVLSTRPRRPLMGTATGKVILAHLPDRELVSLLQRWAQTKQERALAEAFLRDRDQVRRERLAFSDRSTVPRRAAVATPLFLPDGSFVAAVCAVATDDEAVSAMASVGEALVEAVSAWNFDE